MDNLLDKPCKKWYTVVIDPTCYTPSVRYFYNENKGEWEELVYKVFYNEHQAMKFIDRHLHEIDWEDMSVNSENFSENYIKKYFYYFDFHLLSRFYKFSENMLREYKDELDWANISQYQNMSYEFIKEMKHYVFIDNLKCNWNL